MAVFSPIGLFCLLRGRAAGTMDGMHPWRIRCDAPKLNICKPRFWAAGVVLLGLAVGGCGRPAATLNLIQPKLEGWQKQVALESDQVVWASGPSGLRFLAEFPLPGARTGRPTYVLYLRTSDQAGESQVGLGQEGAGFLIQTRGELAGMASFTGGTAQLGRADGLARATRRVKLELTCEDGTQVVGELTARRDDWSMHRFETVQRPADVAALHGLPGTQPAGSAGNQR